MVSTRTTYILWFTLGWLGIHHLYLGRFYHAFVWFATLGGGCGLGWIRDAWRIPAYVEWSNPDKQQRKKYAQRAAGKTKPEHSTFRSLGMTLMGYLMSKVFSCLIPDYSHMYDTDPVTYYALYCSSLLLCVLGNALGIYLVANIGELKCSFKYILIVSACIVPIFADITTSLSSSIGSWIIAATGLKWRSPPPDEGKQVTGFRRKFWIHAILYTATCVLWVLMVSVAFYFNGKLEIQGEMMTGQEIIHSAYHSDAWQKLSASLHQLYRTGVWPIVRELTASITMAEKIKAYWLLGISPWTSSDEISKRCRRLLAESHPDRFKRQEERDEAQTRYVQVNHACSYLTESRSRKLQEDPEL
ncbi:unnamed protein product [Candidula unifasciata]|uniref:DnaJ homolog subfamily C member 22 n=1 Tax=Candidula unifasciata TaxID=100452 RepID=A0A8S3ZWF9_9EUPU|nr:unnamed protein product [Candidula unifasciata]